MDLSRSILKNFAKITNDRSTKSTTTYLCGEAVIGEDGKKYVKIDGSEQITPVSAVTDIQNGDRVMVSIENHTATVIGNYSYPPSLRTANNALEVANQSVASYERLNAIAITTENLTANVAQLGYLTADEASIAYAKITELDALKADIDDIEAKSITTETLTAEVAKLGYVTADQVEADYAKITDLDATKASVEDLESKSITTETLTVEVAKLGYAKVTELEVVEGKIDTLTSKSITTDNLSAKVAELGYATVTQLEAEVADINDLFADYATINQLNTLEANINEASIGYAKIVDLDAAKADIDVLESDVADIQTLVNGNLTSDNIHSLTLNSANTTIENGMIKNAMIESLAFSKISGIDINTTNLTVHSNDGKSTWSDNTIQIRDANRVRVQIGKDASDDYTLAVWDAAGNLIWDALGATENTIQRKIIRDSVVADDAAIAGSKLNIPSVIEEVNGAQTKLKSTTILVDKANQTLDVYLNTLETTVGDNLDAAKLYADDQLSTAQVYALEQANSALANAKSYTDGEITNLTEITTTHSTDISVMQGQISSLIAEDTTIKGDYDALVSRYNSTVSDVDSIKTTIEEHTTLLDTQSGEILAVTTKANTIESDLESTKQTVSSVQSDLTSTQSRVTEVETSLDGFSVSLSETNQTVSDNYTTLKEYTDTAVDGIEIGGRNLALNTANPITCTVATATGNDTWLNSTALNYYDKPILIEQYTPYTLSFDYEIDWSGVAGGEVAGVVGCGIGSGDGTRGSYTADRWAVSAPFATYGGSNTKGHFVYHLSPTSAENVYFAFRPVRSYPYDITGLKLKISNFKLEKGTKATDWTPAPEDVESVISDVDAKFANYSTTTQMESAIELSKTSILSTVSETYTTKEEYTTLNGTVTSMETRLSTAEQKITKDGIITTVGNYYAYESDLQEAEKRITTAESSITQLSDSIELRVEKSGVISAINQSAESITIDATKVNLSGYVTITNLATAGATTIDGANITTGKISADRIDVDGLFAKDITANGTITGVTIKSIENDTVTNIYTAVTIDSGIIECNKTTPYVPSSTSWTDGLGFSVANRETDKVAILGIDSSTGEPRLRVEGNGTFIGNLSVEGTTNFQGLVSITNNATLYINGYSIVERLDASYAQVSVKNPLQEGSLVVASGGTFGLSSITHNKWLVSCDTSGNVTLNGNANTATTAKQVSTTIGDGTTAAVLRQSGGSGVMGLSIVTTNSAGTSVFHALLSTASDGTITRQWVYPSEVVKITGGTFTGTVAAPTLACDVLKSKSGTINITMSDTAFKPTTSNAYSLGSANRLWSTVYAKTSEINTSDEMEKDILPRGITEAHEKWFMDLEPILYRWKQFDWEGHVPDRIHCGLGARRSVELAAKHGLSMNDISALCYDVFDEPLPDGRTDRYGIRYGELHGYEIHMIQKNARNIVDAQTKISEIVQRQLTQEDRLNFVTQQLHEALCEINTLKEQLKAQT